MNISVVIITQNSAHFLSRCLDSLLSFPEIIILDGGSKDETISIAEKYNNTKIYFNTFKSFGEQKNKAIALASYDWILSIDSDEVLTSECATAILSSELKNNQIGEFKRINHYYEKPIEACGWANDYIKRLFNRTHTKFVERLVHETLDTTGCEIIRLPGVIKHYPYQSVEDFIQKIQRYGNLYAEQHKYKRKSNVFIAFIKAVFSFFRSYIFRRGVFFGKEGFIISYFNATSVFYKYMRLYEVNRKKRSSYLAEEENTNKKQAVV
jgi:glycosyltransferase involved in cell wall biosynthesis